MEENPDKNAITIDFTDIIQKLNDIALTAVGKSGIRFIIDNTAFDQTGTKFQGPGEYAIAIMLEQNDNNQNLQKTRFFDILKEYLGYLFGENFKNQMRKDYLQDIIKIQTIQNPENTNQDSKSNKNNVLEESLFISSKDRFVGNIINMLMESEDDIESQTVGIGINYIFKVNGDSGKKYANAISLRGDILCKNDANKLQMSGMGGTIKNPSRFNPCFTVTNKDILTNLHDSAVKKAAKKLGIKIDRNINQFIINTGITDDGKTISDFESQVKSEHRFDNKHDMFIGVVQEIEEKKDSNNPGELTRKIDEAKKKAFASLTEYFRWFCGKQDLSEDQLVQFKPSYNNGKIEISDGDIVQNDENQETGKENGQNNNIRIGYKVKYSVRY